VGSFTLQPLCAWSSDPGYTVIRGLVDATAGLDALLEKRFLLLQKVKALFPCRLASRTVIVPLSCAGSRVIITTAVIHR
jgi:hypothetical protein